MFKSIEIPEAVVDYLLERFDNRMFEATEAYVLKSICKWLDEQDCNYFKVHGSMFQRAGEPDLIGAINYKGYSISFNFEVKSPKGKPTRLQVHRLQQWRQVGNLAGVVRSVDDVINLLDNHIEDNYRDKSH